MLRHTRCIQPHLEESFQYTWWAPPSPFCLVQRQSYSFSRDAVGPFFEYFIPFHKELLKDWMNFWDRAKIRLVNNFPNRLIEVLRYFHFWSQRIIPHSRTQKGVLDQPSKGKTTSTISNLSRNGKTTTESNQGLPSTHNGRSLSAIPNQPGNTKSSEFPTTIWTSTRSYILELKG